MVLAVVLENNVWTFTPGQIINGNVVVTKNIWHKVEGLSIRFLGKMECGRAANAPILPPRDMLPRNSQNDRGLFERIARYGSHQEVVLDEKINLLLSWKVLKPGSHEFPFSFPLPEELPESIKISGFRVTYECVVVLKNPRDDFKVYQAPFTVVTNVDERSTFVSEMLLAYSANSFETKTEDRMGVCFCCKTGPYGMLFRVPKKIAGVGEDLNFVMEVWNETRSTMDRAKVLLIRGFKHKKSLTSKRKEVVSELSGRTVPSGGREVWSSFFRIPGNTPPTNFTHRDLYEVNYTLKAEIRPINQRNKAISIKCPILIIRPTQMCSSSSAVIDSENLTRAVGENLRLEREIPLSPPPTYEEAVGMDNTSQCPLVDLPKIEMS